MSNTEIRTSFNTLLGLLLKVGQSTTEAKERIANAIRIGIERDIQEQNALLTKALQAQSEKVEFREIIKLSEGIGRLEMFLEVIEGLIEIML